MIGVADYRYESFPVTFWDLWGEQGHPTGPPSRRRDRLRRPRRPHANRRGRAGQISILAADSLMTGPRLYATFLLWLMSDLFEDLPEIGDPDRPKLVFVFDEAHLLL